MCGVGQDCRTVEAVVSLVCVCREPPQGVALCAKTLILTAVGNTQAFVDIATGDLAPHSGHET